jgi:hypothetical protein
MGIDAFYCPEDEDWFVIDARGNHTDEWVLDYSTSIEAAQTVIDRISITVLAVFVEHYGASVVARIMRYQHEPRPHWFQQRAAEAKTAPHAICLAALDWTGCELKEQP